MSGAGGRFGGRRVPGREIRCLPPIPLPRPHALKVHPCSSIGRRSSYEYPNEGVGSTEEVAASGRSP